MVSPAVRRKRLAADLRALRERSGQAADRVARALRWSPSKITRYELARTGLKPSDVARLLDYYDVTGTRRDQLMQLAVEAAGKGWWEDSGHRISPDLQLYIGYEDETSAISMWHYEVVPGLLQTQDYARQVIGNYALIEPIAPATIQRQVSIRMRRQQILRREPPVRLSAVLDESILTRRIGDQRVMHDQLTHLAQLAERPSVSIRILPLRAQHPVLGPSFVILGFGRLDGAALPEVVVSEQLKTILTIEDEQQTHLHALVFDLLSTTALDETASRDLILETAKSRWSG